MQAPCCSPRVRPPEDLRRAQVSISLRAARSVTAGAVAGVTQGSQRPESIARGAEIPGRRGPPPSLHRTYGALPNHDDAGAGSGPGVRRPGNGRPGIGRRPCAGRSGARRWPRLADASRRGELVCRPRPRFHLAGVAGCGGLLGPHRPHSGGDPLPAPSQSRLCASPRPP